MLERMFLRTEDDTQECNQPEDSPSQDRLDRIRHEVEGLLSAGQSAIERGLENALSLESVEQTNAQ